MRHCCSKLKFLHIPTPQSHNIWMLQCSQRSQKNATINQTNRCTKLDQQLSDVGAYPRPLACLSRNQIKLKMFWTTHSSCFPCPTRTSMLLDTPQRYHAWRLWERFSDKVLIIVLPCFDSITTKFMISSAREWPMISSNASLQHNLSTKGENNYMSKLA